VPRALDHLPPPPNPIPRKTDRDRVTFIYYLQEERAAGQNIAGESRTEYIAQQSREQSRKGARTEQRRIKNEQEDDEHREAG
jgi:hypothetical protein